MKSKLLSAKEAVEKVKDGDAIMVGGFLAGGHPEHLVNALLETNPAKDLTVISNDTGTKDLSIFQLVKSGRVKRIFASYIGSNPETGRLMMTGEAEVKLFPQGTLAEKIRSGGAGLGGVLTPVGLGTIVEEGKKKLEIQGKEYLLEMPLKANVAFIKAEKADEAGNLIIRGSSRNFNIVMATAADYVIAEVNEIVPIGEIEPNHVNVPGVLVNAIVKVG
ncbi:CoA transferase subunit A [Lacrimispora sp.]|jgi:acetate CoA/acetoacetate CoA-transferase alpha subunit|uniref:CoA transferase subunit A n=1 Tax=Lacrimispora sp. TaxID=2719234 RepID=UPI0028ABF255|nr:CoA transferase subunit A [Lacrimispora sp.]